MTVALGNILVKSQVATQTHECKWCPDPIDNGEAYVRVALPPTPADFPPLSVAIEDAWRWVDEKWTIEKFHPRCYRVRFMTPKEKVVRPDANESGR